MDVVYLGIEPALFGVTLALVRPCASLGVEEELALTHRRALVMLLLAYLIVALLNPEKLS